MLYVKKLSENAKLPTKAYDRAAGWDLYSAMDLKLSAGDKGLIPTDISCRFSEPEYYLRIAPRSGLSWKKHTIVSAGVIDEDYRGNINVVLFNHSKNDLMIKKHDKIAQLIPEKTCYSEILEVKELDKTSRGSQGFGSTG